MQVIKNLVKELKKIQLNDVARQSFEEQNVSNAVLDLIEQRLFKDGTDKDGDKLRTNAAITGREGFYSKRTEEIKRGRNIDRVTLKDTGRFYDSFKINVSKSFYSIRANFQKADGHIWENFSRMYTSAKDFESSILNMSDEDFDFFIRTILIPVFASNLKREYTDAVRKAKS